MGRGRWGLRFLPPFKEIPFTWKEAGKWLLPMKMVHFKYIRVSV